MQIESFDTEPLQDVVPSYLYWEYSDDDDLQAFVGSFNDLAQGYLDWFNQTPLSVYTSANINEQLLDWVATGIYGIKRPVISTLMSRSYGAYNTVPYASLAYNRRVHVNSGTATPANDDIYKRVLTWHLYLGDGKQMSLPWLRRRVARFIFGSNGSDMPIDDLPQIGLTRQPIGFAGSYATPPYNTQAYATHKSKQTLASHSLQISVPPGQVSQDFKILLEQGYLALPFQVRFTVVIRPPAPAPTYILDELSVAAFSAYSIRQLRAAYDGPCMRVRRSSDDAEQDIGFLAGSLDSGSLLAFVGSGNGYITTWYDQTESSQSATQASHSSQPMIVDSGVIVTSSAGAVGASFGGSQSLIAPGSSSLPLGDLTLNSVAERTGDEAWCGLVSLSDFDTSGTPHIARHGSTTQYGMHDAFVADVGVFVDAGAAATSPAIFTVRRAGGTSGGDGADLTVNFISAGSGALESTGTQSWTSSNGAPAIAIAQLGNADAWVGAISETIIFASALSDDDYALLVDSQDTAFNVG